MTADRFNYLALFSMPNPVPITGRTSSITNSFINSVIPVVPPTSEQVEEALAILGMGRDICCAYCGDDYTEWDHLRPLVLGKKPTGYISEIHNLVPACGKCNQSKGNKHWREWMLGSAIRSPRTRNVSGLEARADRLAQYEQWLPPTRVDFEQLVGADVWAAHWEYYERIVELMREAQVNASKIRETVRTSYLKSSTAK